MTVGLRFSSINQLSISPDHLLRFFNEQVLDEFLLFRVKVYFSVRLSFDIMSTREELEDNKAKFQQEKIAEACSERLILKTVISDKKS